MYFAELLSRAAQPAMSLLLIAATVYSYGEQSRAEALLFLSYSQFAQVILPAYGLSSARTIVKERANVLGWFFFVALPLFSLIALFVDLRFIAVAASAIALHIESYGLNALAMLRREGYSRALLRYTFVKSLWLLFVIVLVICDNERNFSIFLIYGIYSAPGFLWAGVVRYWMRINSKAFFGISPQSLIAHYKAHAHSAELNISVALVTQAIGLTQWAALGDMAIRIGALFNIPLMAYARTAFAYKKIDEMRKLLLWGGWIAFWGFATTFMIYGLRHLANPILALAISLSLPVYSIANNISCGARRALGYNSLPLTSLVAGVAIYSCSLPFLGMLFVFLVLLWNCGRIYVASSVNK